MDSCSLVSTVQAVCGGGGGYFLSTLWTPSTNSALLKHHSLPEYWEEGALLHLKGAPTGY